MALVRIEIDGGEAEVHSPYGPERVEVIKTIPGRIWEKDGKFWSIPATQVPSLMIALQTIGDQVQINRKPSIYDSDDPATLAAKLKEQRASNDRQHKKLVGLQQENRRLHQELIRQRNETSARRSSWAEDLLRKLPPEQAEKAYKRLASVIHPDVGGNTELMRDLNVAHDLLGERSWR